MFVSGKSGSLIPIHQLTEKLEHGVDILPVVCALTDTFYLTIIKLVSFGQMGIDEVENCLVRCICKDENINTFDQPRNMVYYKKSKKSDRERFPPTSSSILLHIKRAYLQSHVWLRSPFAKSLVIDPFECGYK